MVWLTSLWACKKNVLFFKKKTHIEEYQDEMTCLDFTLKYFGKDQKEKEKRIDETNVAKSCSLSNMVIGM